MGVVSIISGWVILFSIGLSSVHVHGFSQSEEIALVTFRGRVEETLPQEFMKSNAFLIRFLRLNNLNVGEAEGELKTYLEAREKEGVDNIKAEDVRGMAKIMPFRIEGVDKTRETKGHSHANLDYIIYERPLSPLTSHGTARILAYNSRKTIELAETTGKDIDSFYLIADADGFNTRDHLFVSCFPITLRQLQVANSIFGHFVSNCIIINAPRIFGPVTAAIKQIVRAKIVDTIVVYDTNKENWQKALAEDIDADQLPPRLGGTNTQFDQKRGAATKN